jgi:hypothetical protein
MGAYWIFRLGISSNIDPLGIVMHGAKPAVRILHTIGPFISTETARV